MGGLAISVVRNERAQKLLPPIRCRACGDGLPSAPKEWGHGAKTCAVCTVAIEAELEKMLPAWYTAEGSPQDFTKPALPPVISTEPKPQGQLVCPNPRMNTVPNPVYRPYLSALCADCGVDIIHGQMRCMGCEYMGPRRSRPNRY